LIFIEGAINFFVRGVGRWKGVLERSLEITVSVA